MRTQFYNSNKYGLKTYKKYNNIIQIKNNMKINNIKKKQKL